MNVLLFAAGMLLLVSTSYPTEPIRVRVLNYNLYRRANRWKVLEVKVLGEAVASDHRAILAVMELQSDNE